MYYSKKLYMSGVETVNFGNAINQKLSQKEIKTIRGLCSLNRLKLSKKGFNLEEINTIQIKLQLEGLDLNMKKL